MINNIDRSQLDILSDGKEIRFSFGIPYIAYDAQRQNRMRRHFSAG
ncbi:MAG TPA: hypothetical protein VMG30_08525 [Acidobacteriota bacterium]|nr:hypothetical protein [Acidobacteriota bacterium]